MSTLSRILALVIVLTSGVCSALVATPQAEAHTSDSLHQHGWSALYLSMYPAVRCNPSFQMFQTTIPGSVAVTMPDVMTAPTDSLGRSQRVYYTARLERWNGPGVPVSVVGTAPWAFHLAGPRGLDSRYDWTELPTGRYIYQETFSWDADKGWYRVHHYFNWQVDGTYFQDDTSAWCEVT